MTDQNKTQAESSERDTRRDRVRMRLQIDVNYEGLTDNVDCDTIEKMGRAILTNVLSHIIERGLIESAAPLQASDIEASVRALTRVYARQTVFTGIPIEAEPDEWADSLPRLQVQSLCVAYQQGLNDRDYNPYPPGTPQHIAYDLGKKDSL